MTAGRSSIEAPGPGARRSRAAHPAREPLPRTGPRRLRTPEPGPRDVLFSSCVAAVPRPSLPAQAQLLDEGAVAPDVLAVQVLQQPTATADQEQQAPAAVVVVLVQLEVLGEIVDPPRQQCDLDFRRTGVTLIGRVLGDDLLLDCCVQRHVGFLIFVTDLVRHRATLRARAGAGDSRETGCPLSRPREGTADPADEGSHLAGYHAAAPAERSQPPRAGPAALRARAPGFR